MHARALIRSGALAVAGAGMVLMPATSPAWAGAAAHGGGPVFHAGGGFHGGAGGFHGVAGGNMGYGGRGLPPISGIIHERPGMRPYVSAYGHTGTAVGWGGGRAAFGPAGREYGHTDTAAAFRRGGFTGVGGFGSGRYGHTATALPSRGYARAGFGGSGHLRTALPPAALNRFGVYRGGWGLARRDRFRFGGDGGRFAYGGYGGGFEGDGGYADGSPSGGAGIDGTGGTFRTADGGGTGAVYQGGGYGIGYASETPLAARFAEPPLAPSPGASYSPDDGYAYAASDDVGPGPRIISVRGRAARPDCGCLPGTRPEPVVYRYGVGTAY